MATQPAVRRISVEDVIRMTEAGILRRGERLELIDGQLVEMTAEGMGHHLAIRWLTSRLVLAADPLGYEVGVQGTLPLSEFTYVEPDLFVVKGGTRAWPRPDEVPLLVEVSNTSRAYDLGRKTGMYAGWRIPEYWVVDLVRGEVVVHTDPVDGEYRSLRRVSEGELVAPVIGARVDMRELLTLGEAQ